MAAELAYLDGSTLDDRHRKELLEVLVEASSRLG
jgi:hypothetical protein